MSTCSALATRLDEEMLLARPAVIYPPYIAVSAMPARSGSEVATELGGRYLLRYLTRAQYRQFTTGADQLSFATPTPYSPTEAVSWLALPAPTRRSFVLLLDPNQIPEIRGPRQVRLGGGLEYVLPRGFPAAALVLPWPIPVV